MSLYRLNISLWHQSRTRECGWIFAGKKRKNNAFQLKSSFTLHSIVSTKLVWVVSWNKVITLHKTLPTTDICSIWHQKIRNSPSNNTRQSELATIHSWRHCACFPFCPASSLAHIKAYVDVVFGPRNGEESTYISVFCPGLKKGTVLLEGKGHLRARNYILRVLLCTELHFEGTFVRRIVIRRKKIIILLVQYSKHIFG